MYLGKVIGTVVSTSKEPSLIGKKLLIVERLSERMEGTKESVVAVDSVGAGVGETVILCTGSAARVIPGFENTPSDASIVGIVDSVEVH